MKEIILKSEHKSQQYLIKVYDTPTEVASLRDVAVFVPKKYIDGTVSNKFGETHHGPTRLLQIRRPPKTPGFL